jgi:hypothetical protein
MRISVLFILLGFSFIYLLERKFPQRDPAALASKDLDRLSIGVMELGGNRKVILLGVKCVYQTAACDDWEESGFIGVKGNINFSTPKFLVLMSNNILEQVYTFEFGAGRKRAVYDALEGQSSEEGHLLNYLMLPRKIKAGLPRLLVDPLDVKRHRNPYTTASLILKVTNMIPFVSILSLSIEQLLKTTEDKKFFQAAYLNRMIELALIDNELPEFLELFGEENLKELGASLRIRYRGSSQDMLLDWRIHKNIRADFYDDFIRFRTAIQSDNMSKLMRRADEEGLILVPYTRDMAILYYDPAIAIDPEKYKRLLLNTKKGDSFASYKEIVESPEKLVPLGVFLVSDRGAPTKTIDFERPHLLIHKERLGRIVDYAVNIGIGFVDDFAIATGFKAGVFTTRLILRKKGVFNEISTLESEAHLQVLLDSGVVDFSEQEISMSMVNYFLEELDLSDEEQEYFEQRLFTSDPSEYSQVFSEVLSFQQTKQSGRRKAHGFSHEYKVTNKIVSWLSLKKYLADEKSLVDLQNLFLQREERRRKEALNERKPSALAENVGAAVVFMVDGLRPDRFKDAYERGLLPHMGEYFFKKGVEFNSFTPRSLTLPSWASILTGVDQDEHGVRSNGPMSRYKGRPEDNYIDPRGDLIRAVFTGNRNNRAMAHLRESHKKWLPHYFKQEEVHTNYLPINETGFPAVGKLLKDLMKDYRKILFGTYSGALAFDRSAVLETVSKLQGNPGQKRLILNWMTCVDVFSHHNNHALDICYRELDKNFKTLYDQLQKDPVMQNAHIFLISDHGHTGGHEGEHSHYKLQESGSYFNNTALNLTTLLAGDYNEYPQFDFNPFVFESPYPQNDLKFLSEYGIQPFRYKYKKKKNSRKVEDVLIDYSGSSMAQLYFKHPTYDWSQRLNFYDLTNLKAKNIIQELLAVKTRNLNVYDHDIKKILVEKSQGHPVSMIALPLFDCQLEDLENIVETPLPRLAREPVLVISKQKTQGLIFTTLKENNLYYRYFLIKNFKQNANGQCEGSVTSTKNDPLAPAYEKMNGEWISGTEFLTRMQQEDLPTSIISLVGTLTLNDPLKMNERRESEIPDLILFASIGYNFNSSYTTEADHGGITRQEVKNSFFYKPMHVNYSDEQRDKAYGKPVFNYYLTPFLLDALDLSKQKKEQGLKAPSLEHYLKIK